MIFVHARYNYHNNQEQVNTKTVVTLDAPLGTIPIHARGGNVIPTQDPAVNTEKSRNNPFGLIIALDENNEAEGSLYWDDLDTQDPISSGSYIHYQFTVANVSWSSFKFV